MVLVSSDTQAVMKREKPSPPEKSLQVNQPTSILFLAALTFPADVVVFHAGTAKVGDAVQISGIKRLLVEYTQASRG